MKEDCDDNTKQLGENIVQLNKQFYGILDASQRQELSTIVEDESLTKAQFTQKVDQLVDRLSEDKKASVGLVNQRWSDALLARALRFRGSVQVSPSHVTWQFAGCKPRAASPNLKNPELNVNIKKNTECRKLENTSPIPSPTSASQ